MKNVRARDGIIGVGFTNRIMHGRVERNNGIGSVGANNRSELHWLPRVTSGGVSATQSSVVSGTQINATVPTGAVTGKAAVTTAAGTAASKGTFTVN